MLERKEGPVMTTTEELHERLLTRPTPEQLAGRRKVIAAIRSLQVNIAPMTVTELRRLARQETMDDDGRVTSP